MSELSIPVSPARRRSASLIGRIVKYRHYYALLLPALAIFLLFRYVPMAGIVIAFKKYNLVDGLFGSPWVGFTYFERLFNSPQFYRVLKNTVVISLLKVLIGFPGPIIFALMLNEIASLRGKKIFQTISYLPHFVSWVVVGGLIRDLLSQRGIVNYVTGLFGADPVIFLQQEEMFVPILILSMIWKNVGWGSIIYLAAISSIDPQLYEAAALDGAGRVQRIRPRHPALDRARDRDPVPAAHRRHHGSRVRSDLQPLQPAGVQRRRHHRHLRVPHRDHRLPVQLRGRGRPVQEPDRSHPAAHRQLRHQAARSEATVV